MAMGLRALGESATRSLRLAVLHVAGGALGGAALALVAWLLAAPPRTLLGPDVAVVLAAAVGCAALASDLGRGRGLGRSLPQVPADLTQRLGVERAFLYFGAALGAGVVTHVPYAVTYAVFALLALLVSLPLALLGGAAFGVARGLSVALIGLRPGPLSRVFFRSREAAWVMPKLSMLLAVAVVLAELNTLGLR